MVSWYVVVIFCVFMQVTWQRRETSSTLLTLRTFADFDFGMCPRVENNSLRMNRFTIRNSMTITSTPASKCKASCARVQEFHKAKVPKLYHSIFNIVQLCLCLRIHILSIHRYLRLAIDLFLVEHGAVQN